MWTCRKCSAEVEDNFEICWSCGTGSDGSQDPNFRSFQSDAEVPAVAASEAEPKTVTVATYWVADQAQKVQSLLENGGVPVCIAYDFDVAHDWVREHATGSIQLQVTEEQVEKARELLARHPKETAPLPPLPPKPPEPDEEEKYKQQPWLAPIPKDLSREEVLRLLEAQVSALIDSKDTPDWKVNPAFHPDVMTFIQKHANNMGFVQKAQALQRNRAKYFATIRQQLLNPKPKEEEEVKEEKAAGPSAWGAVGKKLKLWLIVRPLRWGLRLLKWAVILGCVVVFLGFCASLIYGGYASKQLEEAINETDEKDPGWTWNSLQVNRKAVPEKENAALVVAAVAKQLPADWPSEEIMHGLRPLFGRSAAVSLTEAQHKVLQAELEKHQAALEQARSLAGFQAGRWAPLALEDRWQRTPRGAEEHERVATLLFLDTFQAATTGNEGQALRSVRALFGYARSIGDDPDHCQQLFRVELHRRAVLLLQRVLQQSSNFPEADLAGLQQSVAQEIQEPLLWYSLRGDRAAYQTDWEAVQAGQQGALSYVAGSPMQWSFVTRDTPFQFLTPAERLLRSGQFKLATAEYLRSMNRAIAGARQPPEQLPGSDHSAAQPQPWRELFREFQDDQARLRCAAIALAAERYRLANEGWPASGEALVPKYLGTTLFDPYSAAGLLWKKEPEGIVIYSVGWNRVDDGGGGLFETDADTIPKDVGFRLWNSERRGPAAK